MPAGASIFQQGKARAQLQIYKRLVWGLTGAFIAVITPIKDATNDACAGLVT